LLTTNEKIMKRLIYVLSLALLTTKCTKDNGEGTSNNKKGEIIYVETNNYQNNQNAILAYKRKDNGTLEQLPGSPYATGGEGVGNPEQVLGPNDSDTQIEFSADNKFLLAVNSGTHTIAVFRIQSDGSLVAVPGSPFPSGGQTPVSIAVGGQYVYVVNKSHDLVHPITQAPNYTVFTMDGEGKLTQVPSSTVESTPGSSPAQVLLSNDGKFLFGADFLGFMLNPAKGTLRSFTVGTDGKITPVHGTPQAIPGMGGALGLWQHPKANVLYVGFPLQAKVGIYDINNNTGELNFRSTVDAGPAACWIRTTKDGNYMYVINSAENSVTVYNSSNPQSPSLIQRIVLKNSGPTYQFMGMPFVTSEGFSLDFSPTEDYLYIVSQHTNPDFSIGNYNYLHALRVGDDGKLSELADPIQLPVPATLRPQGTAVYRTN
jgi:6-phosphogluconolactonase (cycloisomerase 2 family)